MDIFNSIRVNDIWEILYNYHVPNKLNNTIRSYLIDRKVIINKDYLIDYNVGVPQG